VADPIKPDPKARPGSNARIQDSPDHEKVPFVTGAAGLRRAQWRLEGEAMSDPQPDPCEHPDEKLPPDILEKARAIGSIGYHERERLVLTTEIARALMSERQAGEKQLFALADDLEHANQELSVLKTRLAMEVEATKRAVEAERLAERQRCAEKDRLLEIAWGIIANVSGGVWQRQSQDWQRYTHEWAIAAGFRQENIGEDRDEIRRRVLGEAGKEGESKP
jgi:hypothetical protein